MRIGIDISQVIYGTGVSVYTKHLVKNLLKIDKDNSYVLFGGSFRGMVKLKQFTSELEGNFDQSLVRLPPRIMDFIWNKAHAVGIEKFVGKVDIFHSSDWTQPPTSTLKVTTVHDLTPFKFPQLTPKKIVDVHKRRMAWVAADVDVVIVPSESTKSDLVELGMEKSRIKVIPEAASRVFKPAKIKEIEDIKKNYKISGGYLITVGTHPRKNLEKTIKAFERVKADYNLKLVVVGGERRREERGIRYTGQLDEKTLSILYSGAEALVYPSLYEGFGLPILEAFSCGCPVVSSDTSSLPEVAGDAAILVDPQDLDSIIEGVEKALKTKKSLRKKGLKRAKIYSWEATAQKTLDVYNDLAS